MRTINLILILRKEEVHRGKNMSLETLFLKTEEEEEADVVRKIVLSVERSNISIMNVLIEKEMEEVKLTFNKCKGKILRQKM
jgi:hypothetical protein